MDIWMDGWMTVNDEWNCSYMLPSWSQNKANLLFTNTLSWIVITILIKLRLVTLLNPKNNKIKQPTHFFQLQSYQLISGLIWKEKSCCVFCVFLYSRGHYGHKVQRIYIFHQICISFHHFYIWVNCSFKRHFCVVNTTQISDFPVSGYSTKQKHNTSSLCPYSKINKYLLHFLLTWEHLVIPTKIKQQLFC